jgi:hypothetical protein
MPDLSAITICRVRLTPTRFVASALVAICLVYWVGLALVDLRATRGHVIGSDGLFYYEYLPSLLIDGDLDFENQRRQLMVEGVPYNWPDMMEPSPATGRLGTPFAVGWAFMCSPLFMLSHLVAHLLGARIDGYGFLYESITNFASVLWGCAGIWALFLTLRMLISEWQAGLVAVGAVATTNLGYYLLVQASMSHAPAFFATSLAMYCLVRAVECRSSSVELSALFGLACGLAFLVRPQLALCVAPMFVYAAGLGVPRGWLLRAALVGTLVGSLQLFVWYRLYGSVVTIPQGPTFIKLSAPGVLQVLFSMRHGLFVWHPVYLVCALGLCLPAPHVKFRWLALTCIGLQVLLNASTSDWWAGNAFGNRRFIEMIPFFAMGAAAWLRWARSRACAIAVVSAFALWNSLFVVQYRFGFIPRDEAITWQQLTLDKFRLPLVERRY